MNALVLQDGYEMYRNRDYILYKVSLYMSSAGWCLHMSSGGCLEAYALTPGPGAAGSAGQRARVQPRPPASHGRPAPRRRCARVRLVLGVHGAPSVYRISRGTLLVQYNAVFEWVWGIGTEHWLETWSDVPNCLHDYLSSGMGSSTYNALAQFRMLHCALHRSFRTSVCLVFSHQ